ncbi:acyltransferase family protein [Modestobacter sp. VKM Ac-2984]|uniref:acyltransferase family protein n=1 Tax=Modestobacter sp. VKM Ac-2984 TaxID=3004138 RepID=UPI0022AA0502|nr:acyltransferase family protein [Modestobacter sp. VKM Ac-2984]MCZ2817351.1 acyltransferase family protein [Modestobacter sp. VKM Ac-2984]
MTRGQTQQRVEWVDIAKGVAILLVVAHHAVLFMDGYHWLPESVVRLNDTLATFRMPLFFLASGLFAGRTLAGSWSLVWRKRVLFFAYLYVLWVVIRFVFFAVVNNVTAPDEGSHPVDLLAALVLPETGLWFIYALAVFSAVTWAIWRVPVWVQLAGASAMSVLAAVGALHLTNYAWNAMALYLLFFLLGCRCRGPIERVASRLSTFRVSVAVALYLAATVAVSAFDLQSVPGVWLALSLLAVSAGVALAVAVSGRLVGRPLRYLGQRTIDIYLPHVMILGGITALISATVGDFTGAVAVALVPALMIVVTAVSLLLASGLRASGARFLFALPPALTPKTKAPAV